jgi:hypothetical protein
MFSDISWPSIFLHVVVVWFVLPLILSLLYVVLRFVVTGELDFPTHDNTEEFGDCENISPAERVRRLHGESVKPSDGKP